MASAPWALWCASESSAPPFTWRFQAASAPAAAYAPKPAAPPWEVPPTAAGRVEAAQASRPRGAHALSLVTSSTSEKTDEKDHLRLQGLHGVRVASPPIAARVFCNSSWTRTGSVPMELQGVEGFETRHQPLWGKRPFRRHRDWRLGSRLPKLALQL